MALSMIVSAIREGSVSISKRRFVRIVLASQSKALLLPVYAIVDPCSDDFFDQELVKRGNRCLISIQWCSVGRFANVPEGFRRELPKIL